MGLFDFHRAPDINQRAEEYRAAAPGSILLLDVRTSGEFAQGHIPGSVNVPLQSLQMLGRVCPNENARVFVYCRSGARSAQAARLMQQAGYTDVTNIGGIMSYRGPLEK